MVNIIDTIVLKETNQELYDILSNKLSDLKKILNGVMG